MQPYLILQVSFLFIDLDAIASLRAVLSLEEEAISAAKLSDEQKWVYCYVLELLTEKLLGL